MKLYSPAELSWRWQIPERVLLSLIRQGELEAINSHTDQPQVSGDEARLYLDRCKVPVGHRRRWDPPTRARTTLTPRLIKLIARGTKVDDAGFVYFVSDDIRGYEPIKIGWAVDPERRIAGAATFCPFEPKILALLSATDQSVEYEIHRHCENARLRGEWFKRSALVMALVETVRDRSAWEDTVAA